MQLLAVTNYRRSFLFAEQLAKSNNLLPLTNGRQPVHSWITWKPYETEETGRMTRQIFTAAQDGFVGAYYGGPADSRKAVILMLGDSSTDRIWPSAVDAAKSATEGLYMSGR